jgi:hypothetical protein
VARGIGLLCWARLDAAELAALRVRRDACGMLKITRLLFRVTKKGGGAC